MEWKCRMGLGDWNTQTSEATKSSKPLRNVRSENPTIHTWGFPGLLTASHWKFNLFWSDFGLFCWNALIVYNLGGKVLNKHWGVRTPASVVKAGEGRKHSSLVILLMWQLFWWRSWGPSICLFIPPPKRVSNYIYIGSIFQQQLRPGAIATTFWGLVDLRRGLGQIIDPLKLHCQDWNPQTRQACLCHFQGLEGEVWAECPCDQGEEVWVGDQAGCRGYQSCVVDQTSWTSQRQGA